MLTIDISNLKGYLEYINRYIPYPSLDDITHEIKRQVYKETIDEDLKKYISTNNYLLDQLGISSFDINKKWSLTTTVGAMLDDVILENMTFDIVATIVNENGYIKNRILDIYVINNILYIDRGEMIYKIVFDYMQSHCQCHCNKKDGHYG